jgi:hypothetical protein
MKQFAFQLDSIHSPSYKAKMQAEEIDISIPTDRPDVTPATGSAAPAENLGEGEEEDEDQIDLAHIQSFAESVVVRLLYILAQLMGLVRSNTDQVRVE